jgi:N-acetylmuramoyl-L-alanine amidase
LRPTAAKSWLNPRVSVAFVLVLWLLPFTLQAETNNTPARREESRNQFARAEKDRAALEARPEATRTLKEYKSLVAEYERVYLITAHAAGVPAAINEVAALYRAMGDLFDVKYYQRSINSYQFLLKDYPASKYREDALLAIAQIEQDDLHDPVLAQRSYEEFLALHPRSAHAAEVRAALAKLTAENSAAKAVPAQAAPRAAAVARQDRIPPQNVAASKAPPTAEPTTDTNPNAGPSDVSPADSSVPEVSRIRTWNAETYTRIVIDVGAPVKYQADRITGPDRIYFDIEGAKVRSALARKPIDLPSGGFVKSIRIAQNQADVVRVVFEVDRVKDYSVFLLPNPYRLVVDVYGARAAGGEQQEVARNGATPSAPAASVTLEPPNSTTANESVNTPPLGGANKSARGPFDRPALAQQSTASQATGDASPSTTVRKKGKMAATAAPSAAQPNPAANSDRTGTGAEAAPSAESQAPGISAANLKKSDRASKSAHDQAEELGPAPTPELTRSGQHSLTRALGLKVGRIVIDAGHGGHDTGTIGPTGLMEKDLCLDVALRLGKIIQQRLPGADVIFTRDDDSFVPLERRTEMANEAKADLFLSIHANSSQDTHARGIETYYLNFTASKDAMEVATRENALSDNSVHDLQDIVTKIARNEKISESRDFAETVQESLAKRMESLNRGGDRSRGVRKAPFVVLIGADMPSVLAEVSFLSNPSDEQWLKKPENRQRIAEGLYRGIENYLQSTNSLASKQQTRSADNSPGGVARTGNSQ